MKNIVKRGNIFWFRMRCPKKYLEVFGKPFITCSLRTDSRIKAEAEATQIKYKTLQDLEVCLRRETDPGDHNTFKETIGLARDSNIMPVTARDLSEGPLEELVSRVGSLLSSDPSATSALFAAQLGGFNIPDTTMTELANKMRMLQSDKLEAKNDRQIRTWHNRYLRAANVLAEAIGTAKPIKDLTQEDVGKFRAHWKNRVKNRQCTTAYANKHFGYIRTMIDAFYSDLEIETYRNPFADVRLEGLSTWEHNQKPNRKLEFSPEWIKKNIIAEGPLKGTNSEARDILIIAAETGCRHTEIYDLPASAINLSAPIPHFFVRVEDEGEDRREIKTKVSHRAVPLVGAALDAFRRHPSGFPRYRGKGNYSATINSYLRENDLLPSDAHCASCLRHSYETRMRRAGISNEERAFMMGHSQKSVRGREFYGDATSLQIRHIYAEMVAFPTSYWSPRPKQELKDLVNSILQDEGFVGEY
ncbi:MULTISPECIES: DUF6538 domain-containing protein [Halocynthiibacter]|uniref:DUF6538 domain-containing protein n=1 Tax=Halocynthiibacter halioticoli TaxID=2986804 RepID=A0AAE3IZU8_9RHOB|nr:MULTISPECIES: DUF6538 domain-containing protein [Halocynthiibacter]MCV6825138.1 hypothetical protein [Halocynthiibacter halioticoli]MCW4058139.1 hypothetical protein [Halocynthiibacter sp. SDUM655004]